MQYLRKENALKDAKYERPTVRNPEDRAKIPWILYKRWFRQFNTTTYRKQTNVENEASNIIDTYEQIYGVKNIPKTNQN